MFSGLTAACRDLVRSADIFFDSSYLHDIRILSSMGLTEEDLQALRKASGVLSVTGVYGITGTAKAPGSTSFDVTLQTIPSDGTDKLTVQEGALPEKRGEAAVSSRFLKESGLKVGDTFTVSEDTQDPVVTIDLSEDDGDNESGKDQADPVLNTHTFLITAQALDPTSVNNPDGSVSYRDAGAGSYTVYIAQDNIALSEDTVYMAALLHIKGAEDLLCYSDKYEQLIRSVKNTIEETIAPAQEKARLADVKKSADEEIQSARVDADNKLSEAENKLQEASDNLENARKELEENEKTLYDRQRELNRQKGRLRYSRAYLSQEQAASFENELAQGQASLDEAKEELERASADLEEGEKTLSQNRQDYYEARDRIHEALENAQAQIQDLSVPAWYVQDRGAMSGYANIGSDADSIQAIADVFPVVFFVVAILISLTTVTRMVEEERELIGTYKALGFRDSEILLKYLLYSVMAGVAGSVIGTVLAFVALPSFIFTIFQTMYLLPSYELFFDPVMGILGPCVFTLGIATATAFACHGELKHTAASLMRPKAPRPGARIFLERMPALWNRMSFLSKVTARNMFRYKGRMLMTIFGVAGCMALLLFGFGIRDSVHDLMPRQYEKTCYYDLLAVSDKDDNDKLLSYASDPAISSCVNCEMMTAAVSLKTESEADTQISLTLLVFPDYDELPSDQSGLRQYMSLRDVSGKDILFGNDDVLVTMNAGNVLGFTDGDTVSLRPDGFAERDIKPVRLVQNYLGNYVYMRKSAFEKYFGGEEKYSPNAILAVLDEEKIGSASDKIRFCEAFGKQDGVLSYVSTQKLADSFSTAFGLINVVVYIIILMSAALAFVVLFTLQNTNISERVRELATIKVLGFYDREVHQYVGREALFLTAIGIIMGIPLGYAFAQTLTSILNLPSIYLAVSLHPASYVISAGLSMIFALIVNGMTARTLNHIDPVTALKSVE